MGVEIALSALDRLVLRVLRANRRPLGALELHRLVRERDALASVRLTSVVVQGLVELGLVAAQEHPLPRYAITEDGEAVLGDGT